MINTEEGNNFNQLNDRVRIMLNQRQLLSARSELERALPSCSNQHMTVFLKYQLGAMNWAEICNGEEARRLFKEVTDIDNNQALESSSCENLMLLALSYEEYEKWATRLSALRPQEKILREQRPMVIASRNRGIPWPGVMYAMAEQYWKGPAKSDDLLANGAAILHVMLKNRKLLRVSRDQWKIAAIAYATLLVNILAYNERKMSQALGRVKYDEFSFIAEDGVTLLQEYMAANSSDNKVQDLLQTLQSLLEQAAKASKSSAAPPHPSAQDSRGQGMCTDVHSAAPDTASTAGLNKAQPRQVSCPYCKRTSCERMAITNKAYSLLYYPAVLIAAIVLPFYSLWWLFFSIPMGLLALVRIPMLLSRAIYRCADCGKVFPYFITNR